MVQWQNFKKVKAQMHYLFGNGKVHKYEESDGADSDDHYGGRGLLNGVNYAQSAKVKSRKELIENGVDLSSSGTESRKNCVTVMDNGAGHTIIKDGELLEEIWESDKNLDVESNGGVYEVSLFPV